MEATDLTRCIELMELHKMRDAYERIIGCDHTDEYKKETQDRLDFINRVINQTEL